MNVFFITGCRVSAIVGTCVGHLETDGVEHYLHVTEKRNKKRRKSLLAAARPGRAHRERAGSGEDKKGPLFRPLRPDGTGLEGCDRANAKNFSGIRAILPWIVS